MRGVCILRISWSFSRLQICLSLTAASLLGGSAFAQTTYGLQGLFNTGISPAGGLLAQGSADTHWFHLVNIRGLPRWLNTPLANSSTYPFPNWLADGPSSQWLAPSAD